MIWSISDSKTFRRCQRQWFYKKLGNAKASDPLRRQLYLLSKLQSISAWRGQIVDSVISEIVIPAVTAKRPITLEQAKARASQLFNLQLACARKHELMSPGFSPSQLGSSFAAFHAMEYGGSIREQEIETAADEINRALTHLFSMTDLKALLKSAERLIPQRALIFDHSGVSVRAVPDLIAFFGDNPPVIVDWKVHVFGIDEAWLQLAAYSLALTRCNPHKDFPSTVKSFSATQIELAGGRASPSRLRSSLTAAAARLWAPKGEARGPGDDCFLVMFNAHHEQLAFHLPAADWGKDRVEVLDTSRAIPEEAPRTHKAREPFQVYARSLIVLRRLS